MTPTMEDIREEFLELYDSMMAGDEMEVNGTLELIGSSFIVDDDTLFGEVNEDYVRRELEWYLSRSLSVSDIPGTTPKIWEQVASSGGLINSNYGYLVFDPGNYDQYHGVLDQLKSQRGYGRRAVAVYTRPQIHFEWNKNGMSDFICTNAVNYYERDGALHAVVQMRSNDAVFGFRNDYAWQKYVLGMLAHDLGSEVGEIIWQAASLHVYSRHYHLIGQYGQNGDHRGAVQQTSKSGGMVLPDSLLGGA